MQEDGNAGEEECVGVYRDEEAIPSEGLGPTWCPPSSFTSTTLASSFDPQKSRPSFGLNSQEATYPMRTTSKEDEEGMNLFSL